MFTVLGLETSGSVGSVALGAEADGAWRVLWERSLTAGLIHGRELAPAVKAALDETGVALSGLGVIAVSQGPGSYTGLRVGIAFAKTLAWAAGRPLVGVGSLRAAVENVPDDVTVAVPVLDARWGQVYGAVYERPGDLRKGERRKEKRGALDREAVSPFPFPLSPWLERVAAAAAAPEAFAAAVPDGAVVFGDGLRPYGKVLLRPGAREGEAAWAVPRAAAVARLGLAAFRAGGERDEARTLVPLYLRPTEAEVNAGRARKP